MNKIKWLVFPADVFVGFSSFAQDTLDAITERYNSQIPIDFGELSLTKVGFNDSFFVNSQSYILK